VNELALRQPQEMALSAQRSAQEMVGVTMLVQEVMRSVMKNGEHYGTIKGCGDKPTLLKPGAEKLCMTFRLAAMPEIQMTDLGNGHREYRVLTKLVHIPSQDVWGVGVGVCSTMESKYRYRGSTRKCPKCQKDGTIVQTKGGRNPGGFWCVPDKGGCGSNFDKNDQSVAGQVAGKAENPDIADQYNTVLKMAKKRSLVDATLTATAASDCFTQDIEELAETEERMAPPPPQRETPTAPAPATNGNGKHDPAKEFTSAVRKWTGFKAEDRDAVADARNAIARHHGHASAKDLTPEQYTQMTAYCIQRMEAGDDWLQWVNAGANQ
jgi:hypothetical protein